LKLLDVAECDARIDQLRHQLATMPEGAEIAALATSRTEIANQTRDAQIIVDDLSIEQSKADSDVEQVKTRRERDRARIDAGLITNPKDLERMQHELVSLERRITSLEDSELEIMEKLEEKQSEIRSLNKQLSAADDRLAAVTLAQQKKASEIDGALRSTMTQRGEAVTGLPEALMALYERIRAQSGVGAAPLRARQCNGCQMAINASDLAVIAKAASDEVIRCEECTRILVRTAESGL
jgi:uncharacterized protein